MTRIWNKGFDANKTVLNFTIGRDREFDLRLAKYDILGSLAHIKMLCKIGLMDLDDERKLREELQRILNEIEENKFIINEDSEDIHSQIESILIANLGEIGKQIHSGRSRNDQILVDLNLFFKDEILKIKDEIVSLFNLLQKLSESYKDVLMPGYTHSQLAMPSSFGLWFGAYAEILIDDMEALSTAWRIVDQNPLGSGAGYGSSFPLDRYFTTKELKFRTLKYNVVAAQMGRGKTERIISQSIANIAFTLNKLADDNCIFMSSNYNFISYPKELTTGSSIMPHKQNPDVWELIRAHCNRLQSLPNEVTLITTNMTHGYHRDYQLLKEIVFPALETLHEVLRITQYMLDNISVSKNILDNDLYDYIFSVEEVNRRVLKGTSFRDAYYQVGVEIQNKSYSPHKDLNHTHEGSIGNLCTQEIKNKMEIVEKTFK